MVSPDPTDRPLRVGLNLLFLGDRAGGVGRYARELAGALLAAVLGTLAGAPFIIEVIARTGLRGRDGGAADPGRGAARILTPRRMELCAAVPQTSRGSAVDQPRRVPDELSVDDPAREQPRRHGAAVATVCGETVLAVGSLVALIRVHPEFRPRLGVVLKVVLASLPAVLLVLLVKIPSLSLALLALAAYGLLILVTGAVPEELLELIPRRFRRGTLG